MKTIKRITAFLLMLCALLAFTLPISAQSVPLDDWIRQSADYLLSEVPAADNQPIGGEWAVFGLARSGCAVPSGYFDGYYARLCAKVQEKQGVLHKQKFTEYSRVILALSAIGKDPQNVAGYDLTAPLANYGGTVRQGPNGAIYALLALDSGAYPISAAVSAQQTTRQDYLDFLLNDCQLASGGWNMEISVGSADPDVTGMALQALAKYQAQPAVKDAIDRALTLMSEQQNADGSFSSCESTAQMLTALCELGIPLRDSRFVKNGKTLLDGLLTYRTANGGFFHLKGDTTANNLMSTEQAFYALVALRRMQAGLSSLYRIRLSIETTITAPDTLTVKLSDNAVSPEKTVLAAVYAADGRLLALTAASAAENTLNLSMPLSGGSYIKTFLADSITLAPQCTSCLSPLGT